MARKLLEVPVEGGRAVVFEVEQADLSEDLQLASEGESGLTVRARESLVSVLDTLRPAVADIRRSLSAASPDAVEIEFGIKVGGESGVIFAKGTAEANIVVRMSWDRSGGGE
ncbi:CU044_2847 family protein [Kitasatospora sp. NPDC049258]|uniref:CU044_2847 family protein n=1 Tax=Kitasatospora sp. NPDC049258 TaxID=3155394 RepID=UPI0034306403